MSMDRCQRCEKLVDTDYVEYQPDGTLYCDACFAAMDEADLLGAVAESMAGLAVVYTGQAQPEIVRDRVESLADKLRGLRGEA